MNVEEITKAVDKYHEGNASWEGLKRLAITTIQGLPSLLSPVEGDYTAIIHRVKGDPITGGERDGKDWYDNPYFVAYGRNFANLYVGRINDLTATWDMVQRDHHKRREPVVHLHLRDNIYIAHEEADLELRKGPIILPATDFHGIEDLTWDFEKRVFQSGVYIAAGNRRVKELLEKLAFTGEIPNNLKQMHGMMKEQTQQMEQAATTLFF